MSVPRAIVSDLDGTLLNSLGQLSERTIATIERVQSAGVKFVVATARPLRDALRLARRLSLTEPVICQNGAVIYSPELNRVLHNSFLSYRLVRDILAATRAEFPRSLIGIDYLHRRVVDPDWPGPFGFSPVQAALWPIGPREIGRGAVVCLMMRNAWSANVALEQRFGVTATSSERNLLEISKKGTHKGSALRKVCDRLNIDPASIVAFGDMPNDVEMLKVSGWGVAVANAAIEVQQQADTVALSNDDDGVARFVESILQASLATWR